MKIFSAPLQGYTEYAWRRLHSELIGGISTYYTPFVRVEKGCLRARDLRDIKAENNTGANVVPQIIASSAQEMHTVLEAIISNGYKHADINMGCPFPLQTRHGRGAGILVNPDKVKELMNIVKEHSEILFSVKMRLGLNSPDEWKQILPILNDAPLEHITLHPRIASQQYKGEINIQAFEEFATMRKHKLVFNGDLTNIADIERITSNYTFLEGIMLGRGLLARPTLASEYINGRELEPSKRIAAVKPFHSRLLAHYEQTIPEEPQRLNKLKTFWEYMEQELGRKQYKKIVKAGNLKNYLSAVEDIRAVD